MITLKNNQINISILLIAILPSLVGCGSIFRPTTEKMGRSRITDDQLFFERKLLEEDTLYILWKTDDMVTAKKIDYTKTDELQIKSPSGKLTPITKLTDTQKNSIPDAITVLQNKKQNLIDALSQKVILSDTTIPSKEFFADTIRRIDIKIDTLQKRIVFNENSLLFYPLYLPKEKSSQVVDYEKVKQYLFNPHIQPNGIDKKNIPALLVEYLYETPKRTYYETALKAQAITIPIKIRFAEDSVKYDVSTGFNAGISYGWRFQWNKYRGIYNNFEINRNNTGNPRLDNHIVRAFSFNAAFFAGINSIALKSGNTEGLKTDRNIVGLSYGIIAAIGVNELTMGIAYGIDHGFGSDVKNWRYQNKDWIGIVIGLNFFK